LAIFSSFADSGAGLPIDCIRFLKDDEMRTAKGGRRKILYTVCGAGAGANGFYVASGDTSDGCASFMKVDGLDEGGNAIGGGGNHGGGGEGGGGGKAGRGSEDSLQDILGLGPRFRYEMKRVEVANQLWGHGRRQGQKFWVITRLNVRSKADRELHRALDTDDSDNEDDEDDELIGGSRSRCLYAQRSEANAPPGSRWQVVGVGKVGAADVLADTLQQNKEEASPMVVEMDLAVFKLQRAAREQAAKDTRRKRKKMMLVAFLQVVILVVFGVYIQYNVCLKPAWAGWAAVGVVLLSELAIILHSMVGLRTSAVKLSIVRILTRAIMTAAGQNLWYFGACGIYTLFSLIFCYHFIDSIYPIHAPRALIRNELQGVLPTWMYSGRGNAAAQEGGADAVRFIDRRILQKALVLAPLKTIANIFSFASGFEISAESPLAVALYLASCLGIATILMGGVQISIMSNATFLNPDFKWGPGNEDHMLYQPMDTFIPGATRLASPWAVGVAAIWIVAIATAMFGYLRCYRFYGHTVNTVPHPRVLQWVAAATLLVGGLNIFVFYEIRSWAVLIWGCALPFIIFPFDYVMRNFAKNGYMFLFDPMRASSRLKRPRDCGEWAYETLRRLCNQDAGTLSGYIVVIAAIVTACGLVQTYETCKCPFNETEIRWSCLPKIDPKRENATNLRDYIYCWHPLAIWTNVLFALVIMQGFNTYVIVVKWVTTRRFPVAENVTAAMWMVAIGVLLGTSYGADWDAPYVATVVILYIAIVLMLVSFNEFQRAGWNLVGGHMRNIFKRVILAMSMMAWLGVFYFIYYDGDNGKCVAIRKGTPCISGSSDYIYLILLVYISALFYTWVAWSWLNHDYTLTKRVRRVVYVATAVLFLTLPVVEIVEESTGDNTTILTAMSGAFCDGPSDMVGKGVSGGTACSVPYTVFILFVALLVVLLVAYSYSAAFASKHVHYSRIVFPVYSYDPAARRLKNRNGEILALYMAFALFMLVGVIDTLRAAVGGSWRGVAVFGTGATAMLTFTMDRSFTSRRTFNAAWDTLQQFPELLHMLRDQALEAADATGGLRAGGGEKGGAAAQGADAGAEAGAAMSTVAATLDDVRGLLPNDPVTGKATEKRVPRFNMYADCKDWIKDLPLAMPWPYTIFYGRGSERIGNTICGVFAFIPCFHSQCCRRRNRATISDDEDQAEGGPRIKTRKSSALDFTKNSMLNPAFDLVGALKRGVSNVVKATEGAVEGVVKGVAEEAGFDEELHELFGQNMRGCVLVVSGAGRTEVDGAYVLTRRDGKNRPLRYDRVDGISEPRYWLELVSAENLLPQRRFVDVGAWGMGGSTKEGTTVPVREKPKRSARVSNADFRLEQSLSALEDTDDLEMGRGSQGRERKDSTDENVLPPMPGNGRLESESGGDRVVQMQSCLSTAGDGSGGGRSSPLGKSTDEGESKASVGVSAGAAARKGRFKKRASGLKGGGGMYWVLRTESAYLYSRRVDMSDDDDHMARFSGLAGLAGLAGGERPRLNRFISEFEKSILDNISGMIAPSRPNSQWMPCATPGECAEDRDMFSDRNRAPVVLEGAFASWDDVLAAGPGVLAWRASMDLLFTNETKLLATFEMMAIQAQQQQEKNEEMVLWNFLRVFLQLDSMKRKIAKHREVDRSSGGLAQLCYAELGALGFLEGFLGEIRDVLHVAGGVEQDESTNAAGGGESKDGGGGGERARSRGASVLDETCKEGTDSFLERRRLRRQQPCCQQFSSVCSFLCCCPCRRYRQWKAEGQGGSRTSMWGVELESTDGKRSAAAEGIGDDGSASANTISCQKTLAMSWLTSTMRDVKALKKIVEKTIIKEEKQDEHLVHLQQDRLDWDMLGGDVDEEEEEEEEEEEGNADDGEVDENGDASLDKTTKNKSHKRGGKFGSLFNGQFAGRSTGLRGLNTFKGALVALGEGAAGGRAGLKGLLGKKTSNGKGGKSGKGWAAVRKSGKKGDANRFKDIAALVGNQRGRRQQTLRDAASRNKRMHQAMMAARDRSLATGKGGAVGAGLAGDDSGGGGDGGGDIGDLELMSPYQLVKWSKCRQRGQRLRAAGVAYALFQQRQREVQRQLRENDEEAAQERTRLLADERMKPRVNFDDDTDAQLAKDLAHCRGEVIQLYGASAWTPQCADQVYNRLVEHVVRALEAEKGGRAWEDVNWTGLTKDEDLERVRKIDKDMQLVKDGVDAEDVLQGAVEDCWLTSAAMVLANESNRIDTQSKAAAAASTELNSSAQLKQTQSVAALQATASLVDMANVGDGKEGAPARDSQRGMLGIRHVKDLFVVRQGSGAGMGQGAVLGGGGESKRGGNESSFFAGGSFDNFDVGPDDPGAYTTAGGSSFDLDDIVAKCVRGRAPSMVSRAAAQGAATVSGNSFHILKFYRPDTGEWERIVVDDYFPVVPSEEKDGMFDAKYARSWQRDEAWIMVVEKAFAKFCDRKGTKGFNVLRFGLVHDGLVSMTGGSSDEINLDDSEAQAEARSGLLWTRLRGHRQRGYLMGCGSPAGSDTSCDEHGIVQGHAYGIIDLREASITDAATGRMRVWKMIKLRNPWGVNPWTVPSAADDDPSNTRVRASGLIPLDWSPCSKLWYQPGGELMRQFLQMPDPAKPGSFKNYAPELNTDPATDDGTFWITYGG
jgi:hypothetical protein